jgi:hypothetical protein
MTPNREVFFTHDENCTFNLDNGEDSENDEEYEECIDGEEEGGAPFG